MLTGDRIKKEIKFILNENEMSPNKYLKLRRLTNKIYSCDIDRDEDFVILNEILTELLKLKK